MMLRNLEKTFDAAFVNINQNLKIISQFISEINGTIVSEDICDDLERSVKNTMDQLSVLAYCFTQLMCKTILFSENCFILKERFSQIQIENFHLKSDKSFMDFFRKINRMYSKNDKQKPVVMNTDLKGQKCEKSKKYKSPTRSSNRHKTRSKKSEENRTLSPPKNDNIDSLDPDDFERNLIYNLKEKSKDKSKLKIQRYNNRAFRSVYKSFKETELIDDLRSKNYAFQKEIILLEGELSTYRLMVRYLNNQLSGRIQQIQLLTRDKRDSNFEQVWNDLESEILLNKVKTLMQAYNTGNYNGHSMLLNLVHMNPLDIPTPGQFENERSYSFVMPEESDPSSTRPAPNDSSENNEFKLVNYKNFRKSWMSMGLLRFVILDLNEKAIDISITGGKEYGLPILISKIHDGTSSYHSNDFKPGDIILSVNLTDVTDMTHDEAANMLKNLSGLCRFGVIHLKPDDDEEPQTEIDSPDTQQLFMEYYRSLFNSTLMWPYHFSSDDEDDDGSDSSTYSSKSKHSFTSKPLATAIELYRRAQRHATESISDECSLTISSDSKAKLHRDIIFGRAIPGMARLILDEKKP